MINGNGNNLSLDAVGFQEELTTIADTLPVKNLFYPNPITGSAMLQFDQVIANGTLIILNQIGDGMRMLDIFFCVSPQQLFFCPLRCLHMASGKSEDLTGSVLRKKRLFNTFSFLMCTLASLLQLIYV